VSEFEYVPEGWGRRVRGWDAAAVEQSYRRRWPEFAAALAGSGTLGVAHEVPTAQHVVTDDPGWHDVVTTFGYVLARAALGLEASSGKPTSGPKTGRWKRPGRERLSLLDWGGGPGHYALLARALLPEVELEYHSRDLPRLARLGRELLPEATFHEDDSCLDRTYDLVVASDALHYVQDFAALLGRLARAASPWLYVALLPLVREAPSFVVQQRPDSYGYDTEYLGWVLNRGEFLQAARAAGLRLEREFLAPGVIDLPDAPEPALHRSFLFSV
jgi:putative methyltransferase (TIGR04325 family)